MKYIYSMKDAENFELDKTLRTQSIERLDQYRKKFEPFKSIENFNLYKHGAVLILDTPEELEFILKSNCVGIYGVMDRIDTHILLVEYDELYLIRFVDRFKENEMPKFIDCLVGSEMFSMIPRELQYQVKITITKTISYR